MGTIQEIYKEHFNPRIVKARFSQKQVTDLNDEEQQLEETKKIHLFAHRNAKENTLQLLKNFYFPRMHKVVQQFVKTCETCKTEKYERNPQKYIHVKTPIPNYPCEIIHIDIFVYDQNNLYISSIDKFSKFLKIRPIKSKSILDVQEVLMQLLFDWDVPAQIIMDNESSFTSNIVEQRIKNLGIRIFKTPIHRSETNGQIERCHSTLREIIRCIKSENEELSTNEIIQLAAHKYNNSIHSFTKHTPHDILMGPNEESLTYAERSRQITNNNNKIAKIFRNKDENINQETQYQLYDPGSIAYEKMHELSKKKSRYKKIIVKENHDTYIIDSMDRKIHKCDLRKTL